MSPEADKETLIRRVSFNLVGLPSTSEEVAAFLADPRPDAYERLLMDVVGGNPTLFMRRDEVEAAWAWVEPILVGWTQSERGPRRYPAGTDGPSDATTLIERDGRVWHEGAAP